jgi:mRNA interferase YafQ
MEAVRLLADDAELPKKILRSFQAGEWRDHRDCHIKPDLIVIYRKIDDDIDGDALVLIRLGSHHQLGLA